MALPTRWTHLGRTSPIRLPVTVQNQVLRLIDELERLSVTHDGAFSDRLLDAMVERLEEID